MQVKLNGNDFFTVTSKFGEINGVHVTPHTGLDLAMNIGTELNSPVDGIISKVVDFGSNNIGKGIYIETEDHQTVIMGHLSSIKAKIGEHVSQGDLVAYSGSTGFSTGGHLHLGLKDVDGRFISPDKLVNGAEHVEKAGMFSGITNFMDFVKEVKAEGFFHAIYGKSFFEVCKDFFADLFHDIGVFILGNGDLFLLLPAIVFMIATWMVGRNKFTKWIIPLWFGYFLTRVFYHMIR